MIPYSNSNSGIAAFDYGDGWIRLQFKDGKMYEYTASAIGDAHLDEMKSLADARDGLNTYLNSHPDIRRHGVRVY